MLLPFIRPLKTGSLFLAALAAATLPAFGGDTYTASPKDKNPVIEKPQTEPRFYVDLLAGGEFDIHATKFVSNGQAFFTNPTIPVAAFAAAPNFVGAKIQSRDFESTHDLGVINGRLELGYKILPYLSIFTGFTYSHSGGNDGRPVGYLTDYTGAAGVAGGRYDLFGKFGKYQAFAGMAGIKVHTPRTILDLLHIPKAIRPYASVSAGGKYVDAQHARFYSGSQNGVPDGDLVDTGTFNLYDDSWVFTVEGELGYELQLTRNISVNLESGYGYDTKPERSTLPYNFDGVNKGGDRFYSTVSLGAKLSF